MRNLRWFGCIISIWGYLCAAAVGQEPGSLVTVAGGGLAELEDIPAVELKLSLPFGVAVDGAGNFYIADANNHRIRRVDAATGRVRTVAGTGGAGFSGDNGPATDAQLNVPQSVALDAAGNLYIADSGNFRIRRVDAATGAIATIAGTGESGFSGDGGPAAEATFREIASIAADGKGSLYASDKGATLRVRRIDLGSGLIRTVAGRGNSSYSGDGGPATEAGLVPAGIALDGSGNLYIADESNHRIRKVDAATGTITTVAGRGGLLLGFGGYGGDGGPATDAQLNFPAGVAVDGAGNLYIADTENHRIRTVDAATGIMVTIAGTGEGGIEGDGGPAVKAQLTAPVGLVVDPRGDLLIVDAGNDRIRRLIDPTLRAPVLEPIDLPLDFGRVSFQNPGVLLLRVKNAGNGTLRIVEATPDSGVFAVEAALPFEIGPVQTGEMPVRFSPTREGLVEAVLRLRTNDPIRPTEEIVLRGAGFPFNVLVSPDTLAFGNIVAEETQSLPLQIFNLGADVLRAAAALADTTGQFVLSTSAALEIAPGDSVAISVMFRPVQRGRLESLLTLTTSDALQPEIGVPLIGTGVTPAIDVEPVRLAFGEVFVTERAVRAAQISNLGAGTLRINGVSLGAHTSATGVLRDSTGQFAVDIADTLKVAPEQPDTLRVFFQPVRVGMQRAELVLFSNDPESPADTIRLEGVGLGWFTAAGDSLGMADAGAGFGVAWGDYDDDGDSDLYVVRSREPNLLYRNDEGDRFTEVGGALGVADAGDGSGAAWADYDGDGVLDLYVTNFGGPNRLYRNNGAGFTEVGDDLGVADTGDGYGAAWADTDGDGDPDLYVANFGPNRFFRNDGAEGFTEMADSLGIADLSSGVQPAWGDFDNDGDPDLFLANSGPNRFFRNDGDRFTDVAKPAGLEENGLGGPSFGAAWGDYDNDGDLDLYVTYFGEKNRLYRNDTINFQEVAQQFSVNHDGRGRGAVWIDYDNDGDLDLYVTNSGQPNLLYRNDGEGFVEIGKVLGVDVLGDSRGVALSDFDSDGSIDLYAAVQNGPDRLYRNRRGTGSWLKVKLKGTESSFDAIGTRVQIAYRIGEETKHAIREIAGGSSFLSQDDLIAAFGVGDAAMVDTLTIRWPSRIVQKFLDIEANRVLEITEIRFPEPSGGDESADFNGDGRVNFSDFLLFAGAFGGIDGRFDLDGNGRVGFGDFLLFVKAFERGSAGRE